MISSQLSFQVDGESFGVYCHVIVPLATGAGEFWLRGRRTKWAKERVTSGFRLSSSVELTRTRASIVLIIMPLVFVTGICLFGCARTADLVSQRVSFQVMRVLIVAVVAVVGLRRCLRLWSSLVWFSLRLVSIETANWADKECEWKAHSRWLSWIDEIIEIWERSRLWFI